MLNEFEKNEKINISHNNTITEEKSVNMEFENHANEDKKKTNPFMKIIRRNTMDIIKRNDFIMINFQKLIKKALFLLLIEYTIYLILQLCFGFVKSLNKVIKDSHFAIPIVFTVFYLVSAIVMFLLQLTKYIIPIIFIKVIEFICCSVILGTPITFIFFETYFKYISAVL